MSNAIIGIGTKVKYSDINLHKRGTVIRIERGALGGDCFVRWDGSQYDSEECLSNLVAIQGAK